MPKRLRCVAIAALLGLASSCAKKGPEKAGVEEAPPARAESTSPTAPVAKPQSASERAHTARGVARAERYGVPLRSDEELATLLHATCQRSLEDHRPVIVDFGADWCPDCARLHRLLAAPSLRAALGGFHLVELNLGEDLHDDLRTALKVKAIPRWFVFKPEACDLPLPQWPQLDNRVLERTPSAEELATWLLSLG